MIAPKKLILENYIKHHSFRYLNVKLKKNVFALNLFFFYYLTNQS